MILFILIAAGIMIGIKVRTWRGVFVGAAVAAGVFAALAFGVILLQDESDREAGFAPALFLGVGTFVLLAAIVSLTFVIKPKPAPGQAGTDEDADPPPDQIAQS